LRGFIAEPFSDDATIMRENYPTLESFPRDMQVEQEMEFIQKVIGGVRNIRSEMVVPPERLAEMVVVGASPDHTTIIQRWDGEIRRNAGLSSIAFMTGKPLKAATSVIDELELFVPLAGLIDLEVERKRLDKEIARLTAVIGGAEGKLKNEQFVARAPQEVIEREKAKLDDCRVQLETVRKHRTALED